MSEWTLPEPDAAFQTQADLAPRAMRDAMSDIADAPREWLIGTIQNLATLIDVADAANGELAQKARGAITLGKSYAGLANDAYAFLAQMQSGISLAMFVKTVGRNEELFHEAMSGVQADIANVLKSPPPQSIAWPEMSKYSEAPSNA